MKFVNFELAQSVSLSGLGRVWDLHNTADFAGVELLPEAKAVELRWTMLREYLGKDAASAPASCVLRFDGVMSLVVSRAQANTDPRNARTIISIGRVLPREMTPADLLKQGGRMPATGDDGHLLFCFMDGFDIELAAESVTLEAK